MMRISVTFFVKFASLIYVMDRDHLKVLIVDDETEARRLIWHYLKSIPNIAIIEESASVDEALFKIISFAPDLIFLDMMMPGRSGVELLELIEKRKLLCHIVIVSGAEDAAISAIKNNIYDFILKPFKKEDIKKFIDQFLKKRRAGIEEKLSRILKKMDHDEKIRLNFTHSYVLINPSEIVYCEADGSYTTLHMENGEKEMANHYLGIVEKKLLGRQFFRISRSFLINLDKLFKINRGDQTCTLVCGKERIKIKGSKKQLKILSEMDFE